MFRARMNEFCLHDLPMESWATGSLWSGLASWLDSSGNGQGRKRGVTARSSEGDGVLPHNWLMSSAGIKSGGPQQRRRVASARLTSAWRARRASLPRLCARRAGGPGIEAARSGRGGSFVLCITRMTYRRTRIAIRRTIRYKRIQGSKILNRPDARRNRRGQPLGAVLPCDRM